MSKSLLFGGSAIALGLLAWAVAMSVSAASTDYPFVIRGNVDSVDTKKNKVEVTSTKSSTKAIADTQSKRVSYSLGSADIYKWENGVKVTRNVKHIREGDEVVMKGNNKSGTWVVDTLTINDRSFEVVGRVKDYNTANNWIEVLVGRSSLQHKGYVDTKVKFYYTSDTKCYRYGSEVGCSSIINEDQGIKIKGKRTSTGGSWDATHIWNKYPI